MYRNASIRLIFLDWRVDTCYPAIVFGKWQSESLFSGGVMRDMLVWGAALTSVLWLGQALGQSGEDCTVGMTFNGPTSFQTTIGSPFTAKIKETFQQNLADGTMIRGSVHYQIARNSAGGMRQSHSFQCKHGPDGTADLEYMVSVFDPTAHANLNWSVGIFQEKYSGKVVSLRHRPIYEAANERPRMPTPEERAWGELQRRINAQSKVTMHLVDLGVKTILGVSAHGERWVTTIPAGEEGNDKEIETSSETWRTDNYIVLLSVYDDPRTGKRTNEVEELILGEPDPSLFRPPADYTIKEIPLQPQ